MGRNSHNLGQSPGAPLAGIIFLNGLRVVLPLLVRITLPRMHPQEQNNLFNSAIFTPNLRENITCSRQNYRSYRITPDSSSNLTLNQSIRERRRGLLAGQLLTSWQKNTFEMKRRPICRPSFSDETLKANRIGNYFFARLSGC
jgi:hypothetical protein